MWKTQATRQGRYVMNAAKRRLATEAAVPKQNLPPPIPPPQKPPKGSTRFFKFLGLSLPVAAGSLLGYAWYDSDFRHQLEENVPYAKDLLGAVLPEEESTPSKDATPSVLPALEKATKLSETPKIVSPPQKLPTQEQQTTIQVEPKKEEQNTKAAVESQIKLREKEEKADNAALEVVIHHLVTNSENLSEEAVKAQRDYASTIKNHTKLLKQAMDDTSDILDKEAQWEAVSIAYKEREHAMARANDLVSETKKSIEKLREVLTNGKNNDVTKQNPAIVPASKRINEILKDISSTNSQIRQAEAEANVMKKYKDLVDKGRKQFQKEIESLMPDVKIGSGKKLSEDELNALIAHAHRRIEQLQKQIAEQLAMERQRLNVALEEQRQQDSKITQSALVEEATRVRQECDLERQKEEMEYLVRMEHEVRKQLARQAAAHSDHLKDVLSIQQQQMTQEFSRELNATVLEEREKFQTEVAGWIARLKGIEAAVDARAASEKLARAAQDLWLSCIALNSLIHFGNETEGEPLAPLKDKVDAILKHGQKHPFVETVARSIPEEALENGVNTEEELRSRFSRVARICRRLGLVSDPNTSMYKYLVSYLHSFLVFDNVQAEKETDEVDLGDLDNFDLLAHAQYWMEKGNFELALRFMTQLTGESKRAAQDWIRDARILLETKQCAYTLTAYASASGLANTF